MKTGTKAFAAEPAQKIICVHGTAKTYKKPDIGILNLNVTVNGRDKQKAYDTCTQNTCILIEALKKYGIAEKDIQVVNASVYPDFRCADYNYAKGYTADMSLRVTVRNLDKMEETYSAALETGATQISSIEFSSESLSEQYNEALLEAIKNAQQKAETTAKSLGLQTGEIISIEEQPCYNYGICYDTMPVQKSGGIMQMNEICITAGVKFCVRLA